MALALTSCGGNSAKETAAQSFLVTVNMDSAVKPGDNFFLFANGSWLRKSEIPPTESSIGSFLDLRNRTRANLRSILDSVAKGGMAAGSIEQKVGDFYASGMDSAAIDKRGYDPVKPDLQQIDAIKDAKGIMDFVAAQQQEGDGIILGQYIGADEKNSSMNIPVYVQYGLGLPDRDYYFKTDAANQAIVQAYMKYVARLFNLTGDDTVTAAKKAATVFAFEKQIAAAHKTNVELRDPESNYHKMAVKDLDKSMPVFGWSSILAAVGVKADSVNVGQPGYYAKINELLKTAPVDTWKTYFRFHVLHSAAASLSSDFVNANFEYSGKALRGQQQLKPRWQRMSDNTDAFLGEALGQLYVKRFFTDAAKKRMLELVNNLEASFEARMGKLDWMTDSTKAKAKDKLHAFLKKIAYPDKWRDYSKVTINRNQYYENLVSASKNEYQYQLSKVGKPVDKTEWGMTPPTINAYYNPTFNEIVFPAGILQFPFFDENADDAINYGGIGMVIGHEMTHGFDDQGAQYDKDGNLKNWWSKADFDKFKAKSQQVINLYNSFTILDSVHVNGALTTGENMADIGGVAIAYDAFKMTKQGKDTTKIDGFTPDQRFFLSLAQIWRTKQKEQSERLRINTDPHSPAMYRVNGPLMNFDPFYQAFNVQPGQKMYKPEAERIKIW
ncbi:M13 family peptidase [Deminuibacter soli]|uniref:M13 family peptidase n=2 Tax=Deminuibacter soli TaxID=2291815 RepID=A0A3E1NRQ4_9BACT|nr:M13 family peptidase [Deminuibacter soli]